MPVLKQKIHGRNVNTLSVEATTADLAPLLSILEGEISEYDLKSSGGSVASYPVVLNTKKFSCGKKLSGLSCSFTIKHLKPTASIVDIEGSVIGSFDARYDVDIKADYTNLFYDSKKIGE